MLAANPALAALDGGNTGVVPGDRAAAALKRLWPALEALCHDVLRRGEPRLDVPITAGLQPGEPERLLLASVTPVRHGTGEVWAAALAVRDAVAPEILDRSLLRMLCQYRAVVEFGPQRAWITRPDGTIIFATQRWRNATGLTMEEIPVQAWAHRIHPEDRGGVIATLREAGSTGQARTMRYRILDMDGGWRWLQASALPQLNPSGEVAEILAFGIDCQAQHESEAYGRQLNEMMLRSPNFIAIADATGRLTHLNPAGRRMIGVAADADLSRLRLSDCVDEASLERLDREVLPAARAAGHWEGELQLRHFATGETIDVRHTICSLHDEFGRLTGFATFNRDVTAAVRAERDLAESEARFRTLVDAMPQIAFIATARGRIIFLSRRWEEYTGCGTDPAICEGWMERVHPDDIAPTLRAWGAALEAGSPVTMEHRIRGMGREYAWFLTRAVPLRAADTGAVVNWFGTCTNIAEIVAGREAAVRSAEELEACVAERTRALQDAARELASEMRRRESLQTVLLQSRKMEALGELTGGVAHDFNNVLAAIFAAFDLIRRRAGSADVEGLVTRGEAAAGRAASLVRQLLTFARRQELRPAVLEMLDLLRDTEDLVRHTLTSGIRLRLEARPDTWPVLADKQQLEVALLNLAVNARDAMPDGGTLSISARNLEAADRPPVLPPRGYVAIAVADTGCGMPPEVAARATEPFFTTKSLGHGTGLGLAMVHGFAEQSGGALRINSTPGVGTIVEIILPRADITAPASSRADDPAVTAAVTHHRGATILLIEDDEQVRVLTAELLRDMGYHVVEASGGAMGLALAETLPDLALAITDVRMPGMDGPDFAARLRARRPSLPVVFMTGHAAGMALDNEMVVLKPFSPADLSQAVVRALNAGAAASPAPAAVLGGRVRTAPLRDLVALWQRERDVYGLPQPERLDPAALGLGKNACLVAVDHASDPPSFRFLSIGAALSQRLGQGLDGTAVSSDPSGDTIFGTLGQAYASCAADRTPVYQSVRFDFGDTAPLSFERLVLPLSDGGGRVTHLMVVALFDEGAPAVVA